MSLHRLLSWSIAAIAAAAPLLIGSVHPWTQVTLSAAALLVVGVLVVRERTLRFVPLALPLAIAIAWTLLQTIPLPRGLVATLSPAALEVRPDAGWLPLTVDEPATLLELVKLASYLGLLMAVATLARSARRARRLLFALACCSGGVAAISTAQKAVGTTKILGFYQVEAWPGSGIFGTFVNGNHAASLFTLGALIAVGLALDLDGPRRWLMTFIACICTLAVGTTMSRFGALTLGLSGTVLAGSLFSRRFGAARGIPLAALAAVAVAAAVLFVSDGLRHRAGEGVDTLVANQKVRGWRDAVSLSRAYPWAGVGRGAFEGPVEAHRADDEGVRLAYPENLILQLVCEWGLVIGLLLLLLGFTRFAQLVPALKGIELSIVAAACGVGAVVLHDLADFGLEFPGVAIPTTVALGVVIARCDEKTASTRVTRRARVPFGGSIAALVAWAAIIGLGVWAAPRTARADWARCDALVKAGAPAGEAVAAARLRHPTSDYFELLAAEESARAVDYKNAIAHINRALQLHPANAEAHDLAAVLLVKTRHLGQAALEFRLAAELGRQRTAEQLVTILGKYAIDAVPRHAPELMALAHTAAAMKRVSMAQAAADRALEYAPSHEPTLIERLHVAEETRAASFVHAASKDLMDSEPSGRGWVVAARALASVGDEAAAVAAANQGLAAHPDDGDVVLFVARRRFEKGDLPGARAVIVAASGQRLSLSARGDLEILAAEIAEKAGDPDSAVLARARAKMLQKSATSPQ